MDAAGDADHDDPVPVSVPPKVVTPGTVIQLTLAQFWGIFCALTIVGGGLAKYVNDNTAGLTQRVGSLEIRVDALEKKIDRLVAWLENRDKFAGSKSIADPPGQGVEAPQAGPVQPPAETPVPPSFPLKTIPLDVKPIPPPVCVERTTHRVIACHDARECYPRSAFSTEHFAKVMTEAGADGSTAQICSAKN